MKYLVAYHTLTGNTAKVAEAIFEALPANKIIKPMDEVGTLEDYDLVFIGFPVMQFGPSRTARNFLKMAAGKKMALFVTHAMLSNSNDPQQRAMLAQELEKCRSACLKSEILGFFHCQGELSEKMAKEMMASNIPMLMEFAAMRSGTIGHPTPDELKEAQIFARRMTAP